MKQCNRSVFAPVTAVLMLAASLAQASAAGLDGATITTSPSTNTAGYTIKIHSDGRGVVAVTGRQEKAFTIDPALAQKFMNDAKAARANPGTPGHCMKSASFGTATTVAWHNYTSSDLQCPPFSAPVTMLAHDAQQIQQAAGVAGPVNRIRIPVEPRRVPDETPSPGTPVESPEPSMSPSP